MNVHEITLEYESMPIDSVMMLLNTTAFMWLIIIFSLGIFAWVISKLWNVHSIPKKLANDYGLAQANLVFWLCMLGLIWKPLWIIAVIIVAIDWDAVTKWIKELRT